MRFTVDLGKILFFAQSAAKTIQSAHEIFEAGEWSGESETQFAASLVMMEECAKAYRKHYQDLFRPFDTSARDNDA